MTETTKQLALRLGRNLAKRRLELGITQDQVAEKLGIGYEAVSRMERGMTTPTIARLAELADILGCGIEELLLESSYRQQDQTGKINAMLQRLSPKDRDILTSTIRSLI